MAAQPPLVGRKPAVLTVNISRKSPASRRGGAARSRPEDHRVQAPRIRGPISGEDIAVLPDRDVHGRLKKMSAFGGLGAQIFAIMNIVGKAMWHAGGDFDAGPLQSAHFVRVVRQQANFVKTEDAK